MDDGNRRKIRFWRWWPGVFLNQPQLASDAEARPPRASAVSPLAESRECRDGHMSKLRARSVAAPIDTGAWAAGHAHSAGSLEYRPIIRNNALVPPPGFERNSPSA